MAWFFFHLVESSLLLYEFLLVSCPIMLSYIRVERRNVIYQNLFSTKLEKSLYDVYLFVLYSYNEVDNLYPLFLLRVAADNKNAACRFERLSRILIIRFGVCGLTPGVATAYQSNSS